MLSANSVKRANDSLTKCVSAVNRPHGEQMRGLQIRIPWRINGRFSRIRSELNAINRATKFFPKHFAHLTARFGARVLPIHELFKLPKIFAGVGLPKSRLEPLYGRDTSRRQGAHRQECAYNAAAKQCARHET